MVKICNYSTLYFNINSLYNIQNLKKNIISKKKGNKYVLGKYLNAYESYLRQYGLIQ